MLSLKDIHYAYGKEQVLESLSFDVQSGEFISIIGPSGSGKSTLFSILGGLLVPDKGHVLLNGSSIIKTSGHIGYMPQNPSLLPWRTVLENVLLAMELNGRKPVTEEQAIALLQKAQLGDQLDKYPHELSGGMKQRVAFIRALLTEKSILCLDEPFSALDAFTKRELQNWLLTLWEESRPSILFITHDIEEALYLSDKIIILSHKPAMIKTIIEVPFERPRKVELLTSEPFNSYKKQVLSYFA